MSQPLMVRIPHRLGKDEAVRRLKSGLGTAQSNFGPLSVQKAVWTGDHVAFDITALGQSASALIDVAEDYVQVQVQLPWLLGQFFRNISPVIRSQVMLLLDRK
jgi:hypothetical protein